MQHPQMWIVCLFSLFFTILPFLPHPQGLHTSPEGQLLCYLYIYIYLYDPLAHPVPINHPNLKFVQKWFDIDGWPHQLAALPHYIQSLKAKSNLQGLGKGGFSLLIHSIFLKDLKSQILAWNSVQKSRNKVYKHSGDIESSVAMAWSQVVKSSSGVKNTLSCAMAMTWDPEQLCSAMTQLCQLQAGSSHWPRLF